MVVFAGIVLAALFAPLLTPYKPLDMLGPLGSAPSASHWFGTNDAGQDILSQVVYGARFSLAVGIGAGISITVLGTVLGMTAGYVGRWPDDLLSMIMNIFLVVPQLPLLVVIAAYVPFKGNNPVGAALTMIVVITITGWAWGARVIRSQTLTLRHDTVSRESYAPGIVAAVRAVRGQRGLVIGLDAIVDGLVAS